MSVSATVPKRILSIDAFRGITILVMIFVNELAGIRDLPAWMKHMPADADAMTFVDVVFPAFLFIVGMSVPFALATRKRKGDNFLQLQLHIAWRTVGLLILGVFMVNAEEGVNAAATGLSAPAWSLLFYLSAIAVWNVYPPNRRWLSIIFRLAGLSGLLILAFIYRGGEEGNKLMQPHWWGILGLIGWAYLFGVILYQAGRGNAWFLLCMIAFCLAFYCAAQQDDTTVPAWMPSQAGNAAHTSLVLSGMLVSRIMLSSLSSPLSRRIIFTSLFAVVCAVTAYFIRPYFGISKIYATPSWCLYSAAICTVIFLLVYWLVDIKGIKGWTDFFKPAATNPLLTYILPGIIYAITALAAITLFPDAWRYGAPGIAWSLFFAIAMMYLARALNRAGIRLQL